jgi:2-polyprenyl-3-methyl-5-hydroxy-6-metoxy-1,4-benzoquinol methylase
MKESRRAAVRDAAKYLRQVRPLDPAELAEYVEGQPHPAAVAAVLRESAVGLGLRERDDGTFVPAPEGPVSVSVDRVAGLPDRAERVVEDRLVERFGPGWADGDTGDRLRERLRDVKSRYFRGAPVEYDPETALAYAVYHLPATYATAAYVLADLAADDLVPARCRVLDVGAGVGGPALALETLLAHEGLVDYTAVEPSAAADVLSALLADSSPYFHTEVVRSAAEAFDPDGLYDLILFSNVLSELADPAAVVGRLLPHLAEDGTVAAVAPADRETATGLRRVEREVERTHGATVYAPTVRLWPGETPESTSWSFDVEADIDVPPFQRRLDRGDRATAEATDVPGDGTYVNVDIRYAYSYLRGDDARRIEYTPDPASLARMADMDEYVTERIDCAGVKLSHDLSDAEPANPLFLVGDGSQRVDQFAVLTEASVLNRDLLEAAYGDLLHFENVLVLWNDDERAYNLVVGAETAVDRAR